MKKELLQLLEVNSKQLKMATEANSTAIKAAMKIINKDNHDELAAKMIVESMNYFGNQLQSLITERQEYLNLILNKDSNSAPVPWDIPFTLPNDNVAAEDNDLPFMKEDDILNAPFLEEEMAFLRKRDSLDEKPKTIDVADLKPKKLPPNPVKLQTTKTSKGKNLPDYVTNPLNHLIDKEIVLPDNVFGIMTNDNNVLLSLEDTFSEEEILSLEGYSANLSKVPSPIKALSVVKLFSDFKLTKKFIGQFLVVSGLYKPAQKGELKTMLELASDIHVASNAWSSCFRARDGFIMDYVDEIKLDGKKVAYQFITI